MKGLFDKLMEDVRFEEGLKACMNCGVCTAICPAAEFYNYDPRQIVTRVHSRDEETILDLLKSETIWYCGQCMSCKTRCPRGNVPGLIIMALRKLSQEEGHFTESEKGRQQFAIKRTVGENILQYGYCVIPENINPDLHREQGPVWEWIFKNIGDVMDRLGANYKKEGAGALRKISDESMKELHSIFEVTGGKQLFNKIEEFSLQKARELNWEYKEKGIDNDYFRHTYTDNNGTHTKT
ncbi:MAG: 4Fe-4S dicluster domain-containing protein [Bacteroidales bacterium]|nr:4Fe-4S dicluster domain-containing protein [Bacteroidales bacterium]